MGSFVIRMTTLLFLFICIGYTTASDQSEPSCESGEVFDEKEKRCVSCEWCYNYDSTLTFCDKCDVDFGKEKLYPLVTPLCVILFQ